MIEFRYDTQLLVEGDDLNTQEMIQHINKVFKGDSLVIVGAVDLVKVHYHTNEPWEVLEYFATLGDIHDIVIEDMIRQSNGKKG
jgi:dihydroxyacetone kinase-like predicted kinase